MLTLLLGALELILAAAFDDVALHLLLPFTGVYVALTTLLPVLLNEPFDTFPEDTVSGFRVL